MCARESERESESKSDGVSVSVSVRAEERKEPKRVASCDLSMSGTWLYNANKMRTWCRVFMIVITVSGFSVVDSQT